MSRRICGLLLLVVGLTNAGVLSAQDKLTTFPLTDRHIREALGTDWYGLYLRDQKIGYLKAGFHKSKDGDEPVYQLATEMKAEVKSQGILFRHHLIETLEYDAAPPHALRRGKEVKITESARQETELLRDGDGFVAVATVNGQTTRKKVGALPLTLADSFSTYLWLLHNPRTGDRVVSRSFDFGEFELNTTTTKLLSTRTTRANGVSVTYHEVESHTPATELTTLQRWDGQGKLLSTRIDGLIDARLESEQDAKNLGAAIDLFVQGLVKIDRPLGRPWEVKNLVVEVTGKGAVGLHSGPWQVVERGADGKVLCKIGQAHRTATPATREEVAKNLLPTAQYPVDHPRVAALAKKAVGEAAGERDKVRRLVDFVNDYIRPSVRGKGTLVLDLLDKKAGDCTAYAALFTTLARAAGIPTREVSGFAYMGDDDRAFGGHAWNEVVIDGHWHPIDASAGQLDVDAARVSLGSDLAGSLNMLRSAGALTFRLVEVERR